MLRKSLALALIVTAALAGMQSCNDVICIKGEGPVIEREVLLDDFTAIKILGEMDVRLSQDSTHSISINGQENILEKLNVYLSGEELVFDLDGCIRNHEPLIAYVSMPELSGITIKGSGDVRTQTLMTGDQVDLDISGSGDLDLDLEANRVETRISGSGDINIDGIADSQEINISGSGDIRAFDLETRICDIKVRGSGDVRVWVTDLLNIDISGSGDVYYRGNPTINSNISGSGKIVDAN